MKKLNYFAAIFIALAVCTACDEADYESIPDFSFDGCIYGTTSSHTVELVMCNHSQSIVTIPENVEYEGRSYKVNSIGEQAFYCCEELTAINLPNTVRRIGISAFYGCTSLSSFDIPNSVKSIGEHAFNSCKSLKTIKIPNSVKSIEYAAFFDCAGLTSIEIPNSVKSIANDAFYHCGSLKRVDFKGSIEDWLKISFGTYEANPLYYAQHLYIDNQEVTDVVIPNTIKEIKPCVFNSCVNLTSVTIPNSVKNIGEYAFSECSGLTSITIPSSVKRIGEGAFTDCWGLTSITVNWDEPIEIEDNIFVDHSMFKYHEREIVFSDVTLYVPAGTADKYKAAVVWKEFNIVEQQ